jgi:hypothetical protein
VRCIKSLKIPPGCEKGSKFADKFPLEELLLHYPELRKEPLNGADILADAESLSKLKVSPTTMVLGFIF